jgi:pyruvate/2-oxoglutarate/acetoin dehydrogenase E1 component
MTMLAEQTSARYSSGRLSKYPGQRAFPSFAGVPMEKRIEMPVCEDFQMGFCTGLALEGYIPVSFFPRWDFLIIAANQLINHLDKITGWAPKVIIRTAVGSTSPLNPGPQHTQNHTHGMRQLLSSVSIMEILSAEHVFETYEAALESPRPVIVVEHMSKYEEKLCT